MRTSILSAFIILMISIPFKEICASQDLMTDNSPETNQETVNDNPDSIIFLVLKIYKDSVSGLDNIVLVKKIVSPGKIQNQPMPIIDSKNYLTVEVRSQTKLIDTIRLVHPLFKLVEYVDEGNRLGIKYVEAESNEFIMRLPNYKAAEIIFYETVFKKEREKLEISRIKL